MFQFVSVLLFVLSGVDLLYTGSSDRLEGTQFATRFSTAYFVSGSIKAATFVSYHGQFQIIRPCIKNKVLIFLFKTIYQS